jgi:hypothetical protein
MIGALRECHPEAPRFLQRGDGSRANYLKIADSPNSTESGASFASFWWRVVEAVASRLIPRHVARVVFQDVVQVRVI